MPAQKGQKAKALKPKKFVIDCSAPNAEDIFDVESFDQFLNSRIKVNGGKAGVLGNAVTISHGAKDAADEAKFTVTVTTAFSKRYLKYLTKKFLKKNMLRDYLRVVATDKSTYTVKYFETLSAKGKGGDDEDEAGDDEQ